MNNFLKWQDQLSLEADFYVKSLVEEAKTLKSPQKGINMLKGLKQGFPNGYHASTDEAIINVLNNAIDDAIAEVRKQGLAQDWREQNA